MLIYYRIQAFYLLKYYRSHTTYHKYGAHVCKYPCNNEKSIHTHTFPHLHALLAHAFRLQACPHMQPASRARLPGGLGGRRRRRRPSSARRAPYLRAPAPWGSTASASAGSAAAAGDAISRNRVRRPPAACAHASKSNFCVRGCACARAFSNKLRVWCARARARVQRARAETERARAVGAWREPRLRQPGVRQKKRTLLPCAGSLKSTQICRRRRRRRRRRRARHKTRKRHQRDQYWATCTKHANCESATEQGRRRWTSACPDH